MHARNAVNTANDITQHAELRLVAKACRHLEPEIVSTATLYASTEPCPMCAGAIYWARIPRVVYGLAAGSLWALTHQADEQPQQTPAHYLGPILEEEARLVHDGYWK
jgi:tRNA(Arg) A34 adenosine deaminase TadA